MPLEDVCAAVMLLGRTLVRSPLRASLCSRATALSRRGVLDGHAVRDLSFPPLSVSGPRKARNSGRETRRGRSQCTPVNSRGAGRPRAWSEEPTSTQSGPRSSRWPLGCGLCAGAETRCARRTGRYAPPTDPPQCAKAGRHAPASPQCWQPVLGRSAPAGDELKASGPPAASRLHPSGIPVVRAARTPRSHIVWSERPTVEPVEVRLGRRKRECVAGVRHDRHSPACMEARAGGAGRLQAAQPRVPDKSPWF